jgi:beta-1,4-mannosyl-glycoprotein beta-1,4-N-acetylglucosaminyltransferase
MGVSMLNFKKIFSRNKRAGFMARDFVDLDAKLYTKKGKVFDQFRFFNEFEILEMRLEILWDYVDKFIITESRFTHSGIPKELNFNNNIILYSKYKYKIIYNVIEDIPKNFTSFTIKKPYSLNFSKIDPNSNQPFILNSLSYQREAYERDRQVQGILSLDAATISDDDILILSDIDEIPNPKIFNSTDWIEANKVYACNQRAYLYKLNLLYQENWTGSRIFRMSYLKSGEKSFHEIHAYTKDYLLIKEGGWHFSWMGGTDRFLEKIAAMPESDTFNTKETRERAEYIIDNKLDPLGRKLTLSKVEIDQSFPRYVLENKEKYGKMIDF